MKISEEQGTSNFPEKENAHFKELHSRTHQHPFLVLKNSTVETSQNLLLVFDNSTYTYTSNF